jgi:hypothetical protein
MQKKAMARKRIERIIAAYLARFHGPREVGWLSVAENCGALARIEDVRRRCYMSRMTSDRTCRRADRLARGVNAHSTIAFAAIGDHARLPSRFFARLCAVFRG